MFVDFAKFFIFVGLLLTLIGILFLFSTKIPFLGKLPGDIYIKRGSFSFFAPLGTSLVVSLILSLIFYLLSRFLK